MKIEIVTQSHKLTIRVTANIRLSVGKAQKIFPPTSAIQLQRAAFKTGQFRASIESIKPGLRIFSQKWRSRLSDSIWPGLSSMYECPHFPNVLIKRSTCITTELSLSVFKHLSSSGWMLLILIMNCSVSKLTNRPRFWIDTYLILLSKLCLVSGLGNARK